MGRNPIRQVQQPRKRGGLSGLVLVGIGIVLLLALYGVVSAGSFVADRLSPSKTPTPQGQTQAAGTPIAVQDIARAEAQATAIVKSAQTTGHAIVTSAAGQARKRAAAIVANARRQAARVTASANASVFATATAVTSSSSAAAAPPGSAATTGGNGAAATTGGAASATSPSTSGAPSAATSGGSAVTSGNQASGTSGQATGSGTSAQGGGQTAGGSSSSSTSPDLSNVPASWRVVGYNATFGSGPGSAGSITVTNRGIKTYSGVATVEYNSGRSASASFSGLAPGESEVLPLNGPAYPGGGYTIVVNVG